MKATPTNIQIRLREARRMMQLSMQKLSDRTGGLVSKQSISYYEQGRSLPKAYALEALARALDISREYFSGEAVILDAPVRRTSIGENEITAEDLSAAEARISFWAERYAAMDERSEQPYPAFAHPIPGRHVSNEGDAIQAAVDVRKAWDMGMGPIASILRLMERKGIAVMTDDALPENILGLSTWTNTGRRPIMIMNVREGVTTVERLRFTAAHELAHLVLKFSKDTEQPPEKLCNKFAGAFLIPPATLREELGAHRTHLALDELIDLRELYGVSISALVHTAHDLDIIDRQLYNWWYNERINKNKMEEGWGHYDFPETIGREKRLRAAEKDRNDYDKDIYIKKLPPRREYRF